MLVSMSTAALVVLTGRIWPVLLQMTKIGVIPSLFVMALALSTAALTLRPHSKFATSKKWRRTRFSV